MRTLKTVNNNLLSHALSELDTATSSQMHNQVHDGKW